LTHWETVLGNFALGEFIVIAALATFQWHQHRVKSSGWAALAFGLLAAVALTGKAGILLSGPSVLHIPWFYKGLACGIFVVPYCFFRFAASFRPKRVGIDATALALTIAVLALTADLRYLPLPGAPAPSADYMAFRVLVACQWGFLITFATVRLWWAGTGHKTIAAKRMRRLAGASACLDALVVVNVLGLPHHWAVTLASQFLTVTMGILVTLVIPSFVRGSSNKHEDEEFRRAIADLVTVGSSEDVASGMLPHVCALVGASSATLVGWDDEVIAQFDTGHTRAVPHGQPDNSIAVKSRFGPDHHLVVRIDPFMSYFGSTELRRLEELSDLVCLATERCDAKAALTFQTLHDVLTGLPNRALFIDRLAQALAVLERHTAKLAVMFIDLDQFKLINDRIDHAAGDSVLKEVANRLTGALPAGDTVARIGGDEFVAVVEVENESDAVEIADTMREAIGAAIEVGDRELSVTASIGVVVTEDRWADPSTLLREADAAMYLAKEAGRDHVQLFNEEIRDLSIERANLERELVHAIGAGELRLHYQPIFRLEDGVGVGTEALVRWQHPTRGLLSPDAFIPMAEEVGLIVQLDDWVLNEACSQAAEWLEQLPGSAPFTMWVNKSAVQFHRTDVASSVLHVLDDTGLDPSALGIEITETVFISDKDRLRTTMSDLNWNGVSIAIDDFGTGYSSLSYLKRFPIDILKVDRSFVQGIGQEPETSLIAASLAMASSLDIMTVAEGVESLEHGEWLKRAGCKHVQGYAYCRPAESDVALAKLIESRQPPKHTSLAAYRKVTRNGSARASRKGQTPSDQGVTAEAR
jgi:diguanylate cyclase (GGDEF)-like protein